MGNLSVGAKRYIGFTFVLSIVISVGQIIHLVAHAATVQWVSVLIAAISAAIFNLFRVYGSNETDNYDLAWVTYSAALILLNAPATMLIIWVAHVVVFISRKQAWPWYVHAFNVASFTIVTALSGWAAVGVESIFGHSSLVQLLAILVCIVTFTLANHIHVAGVMWVVDGQNPLRSSLFTWSSLVVDMTMLVMGALCALVTHTNPFAIVLGLLPLYLIFRALRIPMLEKQAKTDAKTGLFHSRHFKVLANQELARANRLSRPLTLVMADLDLLRDINNTYGHLAGDLAIKTIAEVLQQHTRIDDIAARFGGEEFVLVVVELPLPEAFARVEALRQAVENARPALPTGEQLQVTMSFGMTEREIDGSDTDIDLLVQRADRALYLAKDAGRNRIGVHQQQTATLAVNPKPQLRITTGIDMATATAGSSS